MGKTDRENTRIRQFNDAVVEEFRAYVKFTGVKDSTVNRHVQKIIFFGEEYLLRMHSRSLTELTAQAVEAFLQERYFDTFAITTKKDLNQTRVAIKKFSNFLHGANRLEVEQYKAIQEVCKPNRHFKKGSNMQRARVRKIPSILPDGEYTRIRQLNDAVVEEYRTYAKKKRLKDSTVNRDLEYIISFGEEYLLRMQSRSLTELTAQAVEAFLRDGCFEIFANGSKNDWSQITGAIKKFSKFLFAEKWLEVEQFKAIHEVCEPSHYLE